MYKTHIKHEEYNYKRTWKLNNLNTSLFEGLQIGEDSNLLFYLCLILLVLLFIIQERIQLIFYATAYATI